MQAQESQPIPTQEGDEILNDNNTFPDIDSSSARTYTYSLL